MVERRTKILLVLAAFGAVFFPILMWIFCKTDFGKNKQEKKLRREILGEINNFNALRKVK